MNVKQRQDDILRRITRTGYVAVADLARELGLDPSTIRRDLAKLSRLGLVTRTQGGARSTLDAAVIPYSAKSAVGLAEKRAIARETARLIPHSATVFLDSGSTTLEVARALGAHRELTIVTNDLAIAWELSSRDDVQLVVAGGMRVPSVYTLVSEATTRLIAGLNIDVAIIGTDAVDPGGFSHDSGLEVAAKRALVAGSQAAILVADHTKFGKRRLVRVAPLHDIDVVVTDDRLPAAAEGDYPVRLIRAATGPGRGYGWGMSENTWDDATAEQLTGADMLLGDDTGDIVDESMITPEREPKAARILRDHGAATLDDEEAATEPEVWDDDFAPADTTRAGRLVAEAGEFGEQDVVAQDAGIDGGAASAEEAAMHITRPPR